MPMGAVDVGTTSGVIVVVRPLSTSSSVYIGPQVVGATTVVVDGGSGDGTTTNNFGI